MNEKTCPIYAVLCGAASILVAAAACGDTEKPVKVDVFVHGVDGYDTYRIPVLLVTPKGALLAFCEGRKNSALDHGDIDMLVKRSEDGGRTWSAQQVIWDDGKNTCGNPCVVLDETTGVIWLLMTWNQRGEDESKLAAKGDNKRRPFVTHSDDDGRTWSPPREITEQVGKPNWPWYATGPGLGVQLRKPPHRGRLIVPCNHSDGREPRHYCSHVIFSDDHGQTWHLGGSLPANGFNECQLVELTDGRLMLNLRNDHALESNRRAVSLSTDGGVTWSVPCFDPVLIEPICQASLIRYAASDASENGNLLLFSNPATAKEDDRTNLTVRLSRDEGKTWPLHRVLHSGPSAYSCLAILPDGAVACLYEGGQATRYEKIIVARFPIAWLTD